MNILVLRSYGDYTIMLNSIQNSTTQKPIKLIVSKHLQQLHEALNVFIPENYTVEFKDFSIKNGILGIFTNKYFFSRNSIKEILLIKKYFKKGEIKITYLEHKKRAFLLNIFLKQKVSGIYHKGSVYDSFNNFFLRTNPVIHENNIRIDSNSNVIIFPDSRKSDKQIDKATLNNLYQILLDRNINVFIAKHNLDQKIISNSQNYQLKGYYNFDQLIDLIKKSDFIFSSDSLPVHIAEIYNKPHWILYNNKINTDWLTPSSKMRHHYCTFDKIQLINNLFN